MNEDLRETAEAARRFGFIDTLNLSKIMAAHSYPYEQILKLWDKSDLNSRSTKLYDIVSLISPSLKTKISEDLNIILNPSIQQELWSKLIDRWTKGTIDGIVAPKPMKIHLNVYCQLANGAYEKTHSDFHGYQFVELQELTFFLERYRMLLPEMLTDTYHQKKTESQCPDPDLKFCLSNETAICYGIYERLRKDGELSHDNWANGIKNLDLKGIIPADIMAVRLHSNPKNRPRDIRTAIAKQALKRIDPEKSYTVDDIQKLFKGDL